MPPKPKLSESHIADLQAEKIEKDHYKWLWKLSTKVALWIGAVVAGGLTLVGNLGKLRDLWKSL